MTGTLTRRVWLETSAAALAALALAPRSAVARSSPAPTVGPHAATAEGAAPVRLSLNENPFGCSPRAVSAIRANLGALNRYTEAEAQSLTAQIASLERIAPEQVVLGAVLRPLGTHLSLAGGRGGEFLYSTPGFTDLVAAAAQAGGLAVGIPLNQQLENDLPAIAARVGPRTRAVFLVNPHNPSGTVNASEALKSFVRETSQRCPVILDEAYLEFMPDFSERTLAPLVAEGHNAVVFRTFDKMYGLAALQFGYALVPAGLAHELQSEGVGAARSLNELAVAAAAAALADVGFVERTRQRIDSERARWHSVLDSLRLHRSESRANFVFFESSETQQQIAAALLARGVDIGRGFPPLDRWTRITIGKPEENTVAISALRTILGR